MGYPPQNSDQLLQHYYYIVIILTIIIVGKTVIINHPFGSGKHTTSLFFVMTGRWFMMVQMALFYPILLVSFKSLPHCFSKLLGLHIGGHSLTGTQTGFIQCGWPVWSCMKNIEKPSILSIFGEDFILTHAHTASYSHVLEKFCGDHWSKVLVFELMNPRTDQATHCCVCKVIYLVREKETATIDRTWTNHGFQGAVLYIKPK